MLKKSILCKNYRSSDVTKFGEDATAEVGVIRLISVSVSAN